MNDQIIMALEVMGKGMIGIFIALSIVYFFVLALVKFFPVKKQVNEDENNIDSDR